MRHLALLALIFTLVACAPKRIEIPEPEWAAAEPSGPTVSLAYPRDVRSAVDRRDGGFYYSSIPLPFQVYGDLNLRPTPMALVDRTNRAALAARGIPIVEDDADYHVDVWVLEHVGLRDVSDAQWVSTLTGGIAGWVGKLFYPVYAVVRVRLRVQVTDREGHIVLVRDARSIVVRRKPVVASWAVWSFFQRTPVPTMFQRCFTDAHAEIGGQVGAMVDDVRKGRIPDAGMEPDRPAYDALHRRWHVADSVTFSPDEPMRAQIAKKYKNDRFSPYTGHDTRKGEIIGRISLPFDTFGYDIAIADPAQVLIGVTVLGVYNSATIGIRVALFEVSGFRVAAEGRFGMDVALPPSQRFKPNVAAIRGATYLILSHRPKAVTWFIRAGVTFLDVQNSIEDYIDVEEGRAIGLVGGPGIEIQLTPTAVLALQVRGSATFQNGNPLDLGPLGQIAVLPQVGVGLR